MGRPGGKSGEVNVHVAWRMALAKRAAQAYARNKQLAALTVADSVGPVSPTVSLTWNRTATGSLRQAASTAQALFTCLAVS